MLPALEVRGSSSMHGMGMGQDKGMSGSSKPQHVLYCVAGHKLYAGSLPSYDKHNREMIHMGNNAIVDVSHTKQLNYYHIIQFISLRALLLIMQMGEFDELRLTQSYFTDRKGAKIPS